MKTVLVVDDEFDLTGTLRAILEGEGYGVATCSNGSEALERLKGEKLDLVLMDVMMPILSGIEVLRVMRGTPELADTPVVLMSAAAPGVKQEEYCWQAFLRKPFSLSSLVTVVESLIGKAEATNER